MGLKNTLKQMFTMPAWICGHDFPIITVLQFRKDENERAFLLTYPNDKQELVTHDMVKCATVLSMGVIDIKNNNKGTQIIYGTKYLVVFKDGRQGVITSGLENTSKAIESVLF